MLIRLDLGKIRADPLQFGKIPGPLALVFLVRDEEPLGSPADPHNGRGNAKGSRQPNRLRVPRHKDFGQCSHKLKCIYRIYVVKKKQSYFIAFLRADCRGEAGEALGMVGLRREKATLVLSSYHSIRFRRKTVNRAGCLVGRA